MAEGRSGCGVNAIQIKARLTDRVFFGIQVGARWIWIVRM